MKAFMIRSFIGISIGAFIAVFITNMSILLGNFEMIDGSLFLRNSIGSIVCGWLFAVSSLYYENWRLTLFQQTLLHFLTIIILYHILALTIGWIPFHIKNILLSLIVFIIHYFIFWIAFYLYFRHQARKLNEDLKNL